MGPDENVMTHKKWLRFLELHGAEGIQARPTCGLCRECKWWEIDRSPFGFCTLDEDDQLLCTIGFPYTDARFGCVQWEARDDGD